MYLFTATFISLFSVSLLQLVSAEPTLEETKRRKILKRQGSQDLSFCYGDNSICSVGNDLFQQCGNYEDVQFYKCICGNGYVSVNEACYWCQLAYHLDIYYNGASDRDGCSSAGVPIAPIPSSVLALEASYNMTYTGIISGTGAANTASPGPVATTSSGSVQLALTSKASSKVAPITGSSSNSTVSSMTYFGGVTSVVTLNGGNQGTAGTAPTSNKGISETTATSTPNAGSGIGRTHGWNSGTILMFSVVILAVSAFVFALI
ncbi:hypothetical protein K432DRAFT_447799 [Lepidopterella palustris CBS 459.81]|uniref:Uncharacterized protein n=1 Tax=Lepidopterella palustris CBS 459.81 TaxID=1314670 RepID=A0A8E2DXF5_9PEZI|nr:hypothetical protein K432DRAFT_447799 [Lepidopterella palustris CBS 459.81]